MQTRQLLAKLERAEAELRASEERYRALVESHAEMICRFRPDGTIVFVNSAYASTLGTTPGTLSGANFWDFVPEADRVAVREMLDSLTPESPESRVENRFDAVEGERWVLWTNRALAFDDDRRLIEAQSTGIDITRRKQIEEALQESDRRKDEFLATLAHELRNPLAPIGNSLEILKHAGDDPEQRTRAREVIERQLEHLVRLVDDLLDVSRITRDKLELRKEHFELGALVRQAVETCRPMAACDAQTVDVVLPDEPVYLEADPVRVAQVLNNLLHNACKYTGRGGAITIHLEARSGSALVSVKDSGIGMPADKLETVFEMFTQVHDTEEQAKSGLGIGLTLAKRLVELHGGSIDARSEGLGRGSEFVLRFPLAGCQPAQEQRDEGRRNEGPASRRILVVDDNRDSAESLGMLLQLGGHETRVAYDGLAAVEEAERFGPDIVLLDLGLPKLNGIEACRRMRAASWGRDMTIVALTGWGQEKDRSKSREAGFDEHIVKPVDHSQLIRLLADTPNAREA